MQFRRATQEDAKMLFKWRNDLVTRQNSRNSEKVAWHDHVSWLQKVIDNSQVELLITEEENKPVATIRANKDVNGYELSWTVAPTERGKGVGKKLLKLAIQRWERPLYAEIKKENIASIKMSQNAGFKFLYEKGGMTYWRY